jgi:dihydrofolate reductase
MSATILYMSMSLDGFIAGPNDGPDNGLGDGGMALHHWLFATAAEGDGPNEALAKLTGVNRRVADTFMASGAVVAGRRTFDAAHGWEGDHHDGVPVFILSHNGKPDWAADWPNFHFGSDIAALMRDAKAAAGGKDVMVHGAGLPQEALRHDVLDEMVIHLSPVLLGAGRPLFAHLGLEPRWLERLEVLEGETGVVHLHYRVRK